MNSETKPGKMPKEEFIQQVGSLELLHDKAIAKLADSFINMRRNITCVRRYSTS